jgi:hypothetical protein
MGPTSAKPLHMPRLLALSDLHVNRPINLDALDDLPDFPGDELIVAGDVGDGPDDLAKAWTRLCPRFERLYWVPGNHELWAAPSDPLRGEARYQALVDVCRSFGVVTPEDPPVRFEGDGGPAWVVPLFLLYDFTLRPPSVSVEGLRDWAREGGIRPVDDIRLRTDPHPSIVEWADLLRARAEARLAAVPTDIPKVVVTHFPLRPDLIRLYRIPRFTPWCGTVHTADWHKRFQISVAVNGHLHMRATDWVDGTRFEEVALGYPRHWRAEAGAEHYLRPILPGPEAPPSGHGGPIWHR